jgi:hypothetical protein
MGNSTPIRKKTSKWDIPVLYGKELQLPSQFLPRNRPNHSLTNIFSLAVTLSTLVRKMTGYGQDGQRSIPDDKGGTNSFPDTFHIGSGVHPVY